MPQDNPPLAATASTAVAHSAKTLPATRNAALESLRCLSCQQHLPLEDYFEGCPRCLADGAPASVAPHYSRYPQTLDGARVQDWLAYTDAPLLGEGNTPLVPLPQLAADLGLADLRIKNECANPTGSHKDRMSALLVRRAVEAGARTVAVASTGNAGVSMAAYAARAGLECVLVTTEGMSPNWRRAAEMHGATLVASSSSLARWELVAERVRAGEWYPATNFLNPPVGSNPWGVDGYRAVALELFAQFGPTQPTDVLLPTSRADLLWGVARGYRDLVEAVLLQRAPRVHTVEPFPRIAQVLAGQDYRGAFPGDSKMVSIGGSTVTYQALDALTLCGGTAVPVQEGAVLEDQQVLARQGLYLELTSVAPLSALRQLRRQGAIAQGASVALVATSHGYKEYEPASQPIPRAEPQGKR